LIARAAQGRALHDGARLFATPASWPELARSEFLVAPSRIGGRGRIATVVLHAGPVVISRPRHGGDRTDPPQLTLNMVEAREINGPAGAQPLLWRLLTTLNVTSAADAQEIVRLYRLRWRIEEIFRALNRDGMRLEETQMEEAGRLFKLALVGLAAATRTLQLVDARDGGPRPATDVIDADLLPAAEAIAATLDGKTVRQQNPHPPHSLAWLGWIIARLGGWNCYYKPPGPKTMRAGWAQFAAMVTAVVLATVINVNPVGPLGRGMAASACQPDSANISAWMARSPAARCAAVATAGEYHLGRYK